MSPPYKGSLRHCPILLAQYRVELMIRPTSNPFQVSMLPRTKGSVVDDPLSFWKPPLQHLQLIHTSERALPKD